MIVTDTDIVSQGSLKSNRMIGMIQWMGIKSCLYTMKLLKEDVKYLIVHQSATDRDQTTFEQIKKFHIWQGMGNIAYHYFIDGKGKTRRGRSESSVGTHTKANNMAAKSLGVCLAGNFNTQEPHQSQLISLERILRDLAFRYKIGPDNILGHREVPGAATECPGDSLNEWLVDFRNRIGKEK